MLALVVAAGFMVVAYLDGGTGAQFRAGAAIALWLAVILGLVLGVWPRARVPRPALVAGLCLGGLAALAALSMTWADNNEHAFIATVRVLAYLGLFVAVVLASTAGGARSWLTGLALGLAAAAALAIVSRTQPGLISAAEDLREQLQPARDRLSFPTAYWNGLGAAMALAVTLLTWLAADARRRLARAAATAAMPLAALVLYLTFSRGAVAALGVGLVVMLLLGPRRLILAASAALGLAGGALLVGTANELMPEIVEGRLEAPDAAGQGDLLLLVTAAVCVGTGLVRYLGDSPLASARSPRWAGRAALAAGAAALVVAIPLSSPVERFESFRESSLERGSISDRLGSASGSGRYQYWEVGLDAFASAPLIGIGAGGFEGYWAEHHAFPRPVAFAHSVFVGELAELGVGGLALIVGFLGVVAAAGLRARGGPGPPSARAAALAILAAGTLSAAIDWMWEFPAVFGVVVIAAGLLTGPALSPVGDGRRSRFGFGVAALVAGWLTIVAALLSFFAQAKIGDSEEALERGDLEGSVSAAETATSLQPWAAEPYLLKAAALEGEGRLAAAREAIDAALERAPSDFRVWAVAARIESKSGRPFAALESLERANELNPVVGPPDESAADPLDQGDPG